MKSFIKQFLAVLAAFCCFLGYIFTGETVWIVLGFAFIVLDGYCKTSKDSKDEQVALKGEKGDRKA